VEKRLTRLETKIEPFWNNILKIVPDALINVRPMGDPMSPERWEYLVLRMKAQTLTPQEALELNNALVEQQEQARQENDQAALLILGISLALLAAIILGRKD